MTDERYRISSSGQGNHQQAATPGMVLGSTPWGKSRTKITKAKFISTEEDSAEGNEKNYILLEDALLRRIRIEEIPERLHRNLFCELPKILTLEVAFRGTKRLKNGYFLDFLGVVWYSISEG